MAIDSTAANICGTLSAQSRLEKSANANVQRAKAEVHKAMNAGWTWSKSGQISTATRNLQAAQSHLQKVRNRTADERESFLLGKATELNDAVLQSQLSRRMALSNILVELREVAAAAEAVQVLSRRAATAQTAGTAVGVSTVVRGLNGQSPTAGDAASYLIVKAAQRSYEAQSQSAQEALFGAVQRYNAEAKQLGVARFTATTAAGISTEIKFVTQNTTAALRQTLVGLNAKFEALTADCR